MATETPDEAASAVGSTASHDVQTAADQSLHKGSSQAPGRRRWFERRPTVTPPTQAELDTLSVKERQELYDARRQRPWHAITSIGVIASVLFTAGGLVYTARSFNSTQDGQITDRYTKAVEQLGSDKLDIRIGGIYALERLAQDSVRDHQTIYDVLAAFIREHSSDPQSSQAQVRMATDIQAAITSVGRRNIALDRVGFDISGAHLEHVDLIQKDLHNSNLTKVNMTNGLLTSANLEHSFLYSATLSNAQAIDAHLNGAELTNANLRGTNFTSADLTHITGRWADFQYANPTRAKLTDADLGGALLIETDLSDADLRRTNLSGADLRGVRGLTEAQIRDMAYTNQETLFGPSPPKMP
ncbi:hypothetical protein Psi02_15450 [Planotetraspora silvatica]|uniref:Pentapeptide repeat-containing protein n=1 Tax=Planotetraspora silvatica TaxID=234614 RepID=A0A8J3UKW4_9ACTN|nr:pentapeptide repeat-containing protein [Planotetraspora silvatica]GII45121.1 hypothetical protein Psi02_15450 [Planotetraspora silvatica]